MFKYIYSVLSLIIEGGVKSLCTFHLFFLDLKIMIDEEKVKVYN